MSIARANRYAVRANARATVARLIILVATAVAAVLVAGILLVVLGASSSNDLVRAVHDAARFLAGPFDGLFKLSSHKATIAVDWGIAAVAWYAVGHALARLLLRR